VLDLLRPPTASWRPSLRAVVLGLALLGSFIAVQWPFANFMMTPAAKNWFFGASYMDFSTSVTSFYARGMFFYREPDPARFRLVMAIAVFTACVMSWFGLKLGRAMTRVRR